MAGPDAPRPGSPGPSDGAGRLRGITVVDLTRYLPGPYCTRLLADLGASVVKVEPPGGDPMRAVAWYAALNAGKRVLTLDLRDPSGRDGLHALLAGADVCVEGFRPSMARALGVDGESLAARYPRLVHCSISGFGQRGPHADRAAHDLNYQADAGLLGDPPGVPRLLVADISGALHATIAILAALLGRERSQHAGGALLDVSLLDAARTWTRFLPPPILGGDYACYNVYETADRRWIALAALESKFWTRFCRHVGREDWVPLQFASASEQHTLVESVRELFRSRTLDEWTRDLAGVDCCFSPITGP